MRCAISALLAAVFVTLTTPLAAAATVPFVGCPSDGQVGPDPAPQGRPIVVDLPPAIAAQLAFYESKYDNGVLAPRGWHCANTEGSNGWVTVVAQQRIRPSAMILGRGPQITGPAIQLGIRYGGTSGRFDVARLIARYFPQRRWFLQRVIAEGLEPARDFPRGPYPADRLVSRRTDVVEVATPPWRRGLGTFSFLAPSDRPIHAVAAVVGDVGGDGCGYIFVVRLPSNREALVPVLIGWMAHRYWSRPASR
jgi:hypothetical protein